MPAGRLRTWDMSWTQFSACHTRASENSSKGSTLNLHVPWNIVGSCGTRPTIFRRAERPIFAESRPPIRMMPCRGSRIRSRHSRIVDFPQPVFPAKPHRLLGTMSTEMPCRTGFAMPYPATRLEMLTPMPFTSAELQRTRSKVFGGSHSSFIMASMDFVAPFTATMSNPSRPFSWVLLGAKSNKIRPGSNRKPRPPGPRRRSGTPSLWIPPSFCASWPR
mmetsp:Transcript_67453/g.158223  ORF Transcript_67453/g.158223 Transcript_67453/m.158223 type:complete len:219 (-) Transcript_67453:3657-4313(-)